MKIRKITQLCAGYFGLMVLYDCATDALPISNAQPPIKIPADSLSYPEVVQEIGKANVVYLAETYDRAEDHRTQLEIIEELHRQNPKIAIAMAMSENDD